MNSDRVDQPSVAVRDFLPLGIVAVPLAGSLSGLLLAMRNAGDGIPLAEIVVAALFLCVMSALGLWSWLGRTRWQVRAAALASGAAFLEYAGNVALGDELPRAFFWTVIVVSAVSFALVAALLRATRLRYKLVPGRVDSVQLSHRASGLVFSIADLLIWAIGAAAVFAVARSVPAEEVKLFVRVVVGLDLEVVMLALGSVSCVAGSLIAVWAVFGTSRLWLRLPALFIGVAVVAWLILGVYTLPVRGVRFWIASLEVVPFVWLQSLLVAGGLCAYRACDYRLVRVDARPAAVFERAKFPATEPLAAPSLGLTHSPVGK